MIQRNEGVVLEITQDTFYARLVSEGEPDREAVFQRAMLPLKEREFLRVGAVFDWNIGDGVTVWRFHRLPAVTPASIAQAKERAHQLRQLLGIA